MNDAFDQFWQWREKPPGSRLAISKEIYSAVMSLPEPERTSRKAVNAAVENWAELRRNGQTVWVYLNDFNNGHQRKPGDPDWVNSSARMTLPTAGSRNTIRKASPGHMRSKADRDAPPFGSISRMNTPRRSETPLGLSCSPLSKSQNNGWSRTLSMARFGTIHSRSKKA